MKKLAFFGTHEFGAAMLRTILNSKKYTIEAVVTQPDKPIGRSQEVSKSAVKLLAEENQLRVIQPESLKNYQFDFTWDITVVCQYGLIIPKAILDIPKYGNINIHTSLLPKYRGPSPIQSTLINGETKTGVSIMLMDEKMDHGPILSQSEVEINPDDTYPTLSLKLQNEAEKILISNLNMWVEGKLTPQPQQDDNATYCKILTRDDGRIKWERTDIEIYNQYRGLTPWPGIWTIWKGKRLKLLSIRPVENNLAPGEVYADKKILIGCGSGAIEVLKLQLEGKRALKSVDFVAGNPINGEILE